MPSKDKLTTKDKAVSMSFKVVLFSALNELNHGNLFKRLGNSVAISADAYDDKIFIILSVCPKYIYRRHRLGFDSDKKTSKTACVHNWN